MRDAKVYQVSEYEKKVVTRNGRVLRLIKYNGETKLLSEWAEITGIPYASLQVRLNYLARGSLATIDEVFSRERFKSGLGKKSKKRS